MGDRVGENKLLPRTSFSIFVPLPDISLKFSISSTYALNEKFNEVIKKNKQNKTYILRKWFFEIFGVRSNSDLLTKKSHKTINPHYNEEIVKTVAIVRDMYLNEAGIGRSEFSAHYRKKMEEFVKKYEK